MITHQGRLVISSILALLGTVGMTQEGRITHGLSYGVDILSPARHKRVEVVEGWSSWLLTCLGWYIDCVMTSHTF